MNAFNPGLMPGSGLARDYSGIQRFAWRFVMPVLAGAAAGQQRRGVGPRAWPRSPPTSGTPSVSGVYFDGLKQARSSEDSYDEAKARDLWETSEASVGGAQCELRLTSHVPTAV